MEVKFQAKPNLNNSVNLKTFDTEEEAVSYLNKITGFPMKVIAKNPPFRGGKP